MNVHLSRSLNVHAHSGQPTKNVLVLICAAGAKKGAARAVRAFAWLRGGWREEVVGAEQRLWTRGQQRWPTSEMRE